VRDVIVDTHSGKVEGLEKRGVLQFRGIPYATAERFAPPRRIERWSGVRDATKFGPIAPQPPTVASPLGARPGGGSEDCLVLNVFTPAGGLDGSRPVMVWIHGGGFTGGAGSVPWYDGTSLAANGDVVVVTINYRLGALGFLHLAHRFPELAGSGANGIRDQVMALEWVGDNVAAFGGDPARVTIFGESAGGMSVGTLLGTPAAAGLFRGAIAQSGACANVHDAESGAAVADRFVDALGLAPDDLDGLRAAPVDAVLAAQVAADPRAGGEGAGDRPRYGLLAFQPVVDGAVLPVPPLDAVRAGSAAGVSLVAGSTADEWNLFHAIVRARGPLDEDQVRRRLGGVVEPDRVGELWDAYREARPGADPDAVLCAAMTDFVFRMPGVRLAEAQLAHAPVAMYRFDYASPSFGACHGIDVPFVFDNLDRQGVEFLLAGSDGLDAGAHRLAGRAARAWTTMAHAGAPATDDLPWPAYDTTDRATCVLDREPSVLADPEGGLRRLWDELAPIPGSGAVVD
jgi:para-nitrobenzyl esterase